MINFEDGMFAPQLLPEFNLSRHSKKDKDALVEQVMVRSQRFESKMSPFYGEWNEAADNWRMLTRANSRGDSGLFNAKSGESNRAINVLASIWFRMLTSSDPYVEVYAQGLNPFGQEYSEEELYAAREVLVKQLEFIRFKPKLLKALRSLATFGTAIVEKPFISLPYGNGQKLMEATDFVFRSLVQCGFDPDCYDIRSSDYIYTVDYLSKSQLLNMAYQNDQTWDKVAIDAYFSNEEIFGSSKKQSDVYEQIQTRRSRAGYSNDGDKQKELINMHGKFDMKGNSIFEAYWESQGRQDDMRFVDWTVGVLEGSELVRFHTAPYGSWKNNFEILSWNEFELETIGYGVGKLGKRYQRELDLIQSRTNDNLMIQTYFMSLTNKFSGLQSGQLKFSPFGIVQLEDVEQFKPLRGDPSTIPSALQMMALAKEDFRTITAASTNLQASINDSSTATEASLAQAEGIRNNAVIAELIGESIRGFFDTSHVNNIYHLDSSIYAQITGSFGQISKYFDKNDLPINVGFKTKVTTDKDYAPAMIKSLLETLQIYTSVRGIVPETFNVIEPLTEKIFRLHGVDPRLLKKPKPMADILSERMQRMGKANALGAGQQIAAETMGSPGGGGANISTPVGVVPTSPVGSEVQYAA